MARAGSTATCTVLVGADDRGGYRGMPWTRLDPAGVIRHLRAEWDEAGPVGDELAERALAHVREELLSGRYVAVQDGRGHTFIGTPDEAAEHMMGQAGE